MTSRPARRPSWGTLALVAPGSLAFLAATVVWVSGHDPRAADVPPDASGPTTASATPAIPGPADPRGDGFADQDAATSLRLARLQVLLGQAEAELLLLEQGGGVSMQTPSPVLADVPPKAAVQPPVAPSPAPVAHATTGASGA